MDIYVGNLSYTLDKEELKNVFAQFGEVTSATITTDRETGKSRGFGFVQMPNAAEAEKAIQELDQSDVFGRRLVVNQAKPKTKK